MNAKEIVKQFVEAINRQDAEGLYQLMTDDHAFIDSDGSSHSGKEEMRQGWQGYFKLVPDHTIHVQEEYSSGDIVVMTGKAEGTYVHPTDDNPKPGNHFQIPAAWRGVVSGEKVKVWQVYLNPVPLLDIMKKYDNEEKESPESRE